MKIVADDKIPFLRGALEDEASVVYLGGSAISPADVRDADALIVRTRTRCNEQLLSGSSVRAIFTATIGFDHIDRRYCESKNIYWENAPGCNAPSVQQYIGSALSVLKLRTGMSLKDSTIAIVGVGNVGKLVEKWARMIGMHVILVDPIRAEVEGDECFTEYRKALSQADIVTFHVPLRRTGRHATYHLFDHNTLGSLKRGVVIINSSRGEVCDTEALHEGLDDGIISNIIVDVWENETHFDRRLMSRALIATPHVAGYSTDSKLRGTQMSVDALRRHFRMKGTNVWPTLPAPDNANIAIDASDPEEALAQMMLGVYDIMADDKALRANPDAFESIRGNYHLRREIDSFRLAPNAPFAEYLRQFGIN